MSIKILQNIIYELMRRIKRPGRFSLESFKREMAGKYKISCPTNLALLSTYHRLFKKRSIARERVSGNKGQDLLEQLLKVRPVRSLSGIVNVSVLTKPYPCPGRCIYCPTEKGIPKSYVSGEPAVERAKALNYHPYWQVQKRLEMLRQNGHPIDKVELRIIGGTWSYQPRQYQRWFIKECFLAANQTTNKPFQFERAQKKNEKARSRIVGITVETRPDFIDIEEIKRMRELGITRVELGAQSIYDDVLNRNKRGHNVAATIKATRLLKDAGFKVSYQMMPNLLGSNFNKDIKMFAELFSSPDFQPDLLKIYPLALVKNTLLYNDYKKNKYKPYSLKKLIELLMAIKQKIPYWCRIERIMRDIPSAQIVEGGAKTLNLREVVQKEMEKRGVQCKCIRCREVRGDYIPDERPYLFRSDYLASQAREVFLCLENKTRTKLYALLRLRLVPGANNFLPALKDAAIIREVHTYGRLTPLGEKGFSPQHRWLGRKLIQEAEKIAKSYGLKKIAVIAAVGTRNYYRRLGYRLKDTYMVKLL